MSDLADDDSAQEGSKKPKTESDDDILKEARERYQACETAESDNRTAALDDLLFLSGGLNQWNPADAAVRTAERRPCLTINNLPTFLHQVTNQQRMNKPAVKVHPVDDNADVETAEVMQGLIRHIEYSSNAGVAYDTAVNSAAAVGFGWFRLCTEYEDDKSFDQKIMFKRIRNALSVHIDPLSQDPDGSDMKFAFIDSLESREEFKRQYPDADANNTDLIGQDTYRGWFTDKTVLVCEYYRIKETPDTLCELPDGAKVWKSEVPKGVKPRRERKSYRCAVEWFKLTGSDVLERTEIKCKWIPVFPVYGDEIDIEGRVVRSGVIRNAKDPFKMYNYWITCATEEVALRPKSPFIMGEGQDEGHPEWNFANQRSYSKLVYKPTTVDGLLVPAPQRQPMADVPSGMLAMAMHASDNKKATTGLFDSSLGARGAATSGVQERALQQQGDVANFHYTDNLNTTVGHVGRCLLSMIPHYYDGARTIRILGEDDTADQVKVNQPVEEKNAKTRAIETVTYDLTAGQYDMTVAAGPSYSTKRQEAAEFLTNAMQAAKDPAASAVITYLAFQNQDLAGAQEATKMLKKLLPAGLVDPDDDDPEPMVQTPQGPMPASQVGKLIEQMGVALQNADRQLEQAGLEKQAIQAGELGVKQKDAATKAYEAETKRVQAEDQAAIDAREAEAKAIQAEADRLAALADLERAQAEKIAAETGRTPPAPSIEEIAAIVAAAKPPVPVGMAIKAPSGTVYDVEFRG